MSEQESVIDKAIEDSAAEAPAESVQSEGAVVGKPEPEVDQTWYWSEEKKGDGNAPEWLLKDKYKSVEEQAKANVAAQKYIGELKQKIGATVGAPEEYNFSSLENVSIKEDDPMLSQFSEMLKKNNVSQEFANELVSFYVGTNANNPEVVLDYSAERDKLAKEHGIDASELVSMKNWATNTLTESSAAIVKDMMDNPTVEGVKLLKELQRMNIQSAPPTGFEHAPKEETVADINAEYRSKLDDRERDPVGFEKYRKVYYERLKRAQERSHRH